MCFSPPGPPLQTTQRAPLIACLCPSPPPSIHQFDYPSLTTRLLASSFPSCHPTLVFQPPSHLRSGRNLFAEVRQSGVAEWSLFLSYRCYSNRQAPPLVLLITRSLLRRDKKKHALFFTTSPLFFHLSLEPKRFSVRRSLDGLALRLEAGLTNRNREEKKVPAPKKRPSAPVWEERYASIHSNLLLPLMEF